MLFIIFALCSTYQNTHSKFLRRFKVCCLDSIIYKSQLKFELIKEAF